MLQGSLDNFALDEVLGLLSSTAKTGQLDIKGDRGSGSLLFSEGSLVDAKASFTANGTGIEDVMFELLRYQEGNFNFNSREVPVTDEAENVDSVLASAEDRLADWRQIEAVVPSLDHMVLPAHDLPAEEVSINRAEWAVLTVIAAGCPASTVCDRLDMGEVEGSRQIKNLAERALIVVGEPKGTPGPATVARRPVTPVSSIPAAAPAAATASTRIDANGNGSADHSDESGDLNKLIGEDSRPPMPPSPAEIDAFKGNLEDASELTEGAADSPGSGLLMKYLKNDG